MAYGIMIRNTSAAIGAVLAIACASAPLQAQIPLISPAIGAAGVVVDAVTGIVRHKSRDPLNSSATQRTNHFKNHAPKKVRFLSSNSNRY